jgi:hypothetical protein
MKTIMERWRYECENSGTDPFNVTNLDNPTPKLVNDLDLRVVSPTGSTNLP